MALYEYKCKDCGTVAEQLVFSSEDAPECPKCGSKKLEKLMSAFAVASAPAKSSGPLPGCASGCCNGACGLH